MTEAEYLRRLIKAIDYVLDTEYGLSEVSRITLEEEPSKKLWFKDILPALDYEIEGGTWENPKWGFEVHPWFEALNLTKEECEDWLQNE